MKIHSDFSLEEIARRLLALQIAQSRRSAKIEAVGIDLQDPITGNYLLLKLALDVLGVPEERFAGEGEEWREGVHFSREWLIDVFEICGVQHGDIDRVISIALGEEKIPEWKNSAELEAILYPADQSK